MSSSGRAALVLTVIGMLLPGVPARAMIGCPRARYLVGGNPADVITIDGKEVTLGGECAKVQVKKLTGSRKGLRVRTPWSVCGTRRMRFKGRLQPGCGMLTGVRRLKGGRAERVTAPMSTCGDGILDRGAETCERGSLCADGQGCAYDCTCPEPLTPPTVPTTTVTVTTDTSAATTTVAGTTSTTAASVTTTTVPAVCGDGTRDEAEECDGDDLGGHVCPADGAAEKPVCRNCTLDFSACPDEEEDDDTFAVIEQRIIGPHGCAVSSCHGALHQGNLDLRPGTAYLALVGVPADNPSAHGAGMMRVQAGNVAASFLSKKLHGTLAPDQGQRMPYVGSVLSDAEIQFVDVWIAGGAPATGVVPGTPDLPPLVYEPAPPLPPPPGGYQLVLQGPTLLPGEEDEGCYWTAVPNTSDFLVGKWEFSLNPGTHHFAIFPYANAGAPPLLNTWRDKNYGCIPGSMFGNNLSGAPFAPYFVDSYPAGVARKLTAGSYIGLNAHYHNGFTVPIEMKVWINIYPYSGPSSPHIASTIIALDDTYRINVPPFTQQVLRGRWKNTSAKPYRILGIAGHMHKRGLRFTAWQSDGTKVYESFDWEHPGGHGYEPPFVLQPGDWFDYECLHDNGVDREVRRDTNGQPTTLRFGVTTDDEMCILTGSYYVD